jgi:hypothetical protein
MRFIPSPTKTLIGLHPHTPTLIFKMPVEEKEERIKAQELRIEKQEARDRGRYSIISPSLAKAKASERRSND